MDQTIELKEIKRKDTMKNAKKFDINNIISTKNSNDYNFTNDNLTLQMPKIFNFNNSNKDSKQNDNFNKSNKKILKMKKIEEDKNGNEKNSKTKKNKNNEKNVSIIIEDKEKGKEKTKQKIKEKENNKEKIKEKENNIEKPKEKEKVNEMRKSKKKKIKNDKKSKKLSFVRNNGEQSPKKNKIRFSELIIRKDIKDTINDINLEFMNEIKEDNDTND